MHFWEALLLGIVQGVTEFLPVSSTGHLVILEHIWNLQMSDQLLFEVLLHVATLVAVCAVLRGDILRIFWESIRMCEDVWYNLKTFFYNTIHEPEEKEYRKILHNNYRRLTVMLLVSSIPTAVIGYLFRGFVHRWGHSVTAAGLGLLVTAVFLFVVDYWHFGDKIPKNISTRQAALIGVCQGFAILPGISRSGVTISTGLFFGFRKNFAIKYSFLLSIPAILGGLIVELGQVKKVSMSWQLGFSYGIGMVAAGVSGYFAIQFMLRLLQRNRFRIFSLYCFLVGTTTLIIHYAV